MNHAPHVIVAGGGLAGISAALECADQGARVTLLERRSRLGGLTWSFRHGDMWVDNGQHVFLRCCTEYLSFLRRIGADGDVELPDRLDIPVLAPARRPGARPTVGRLRRSSGPPPLHLLASLLRYPHLPPGDRLRLGRAVAGLQRLRLADPRLDDQTFGSWLAAHGQSPEAIATVWDLITVPTVNLPAAEASLAMAAMVFKTGLLSRADAADIGWSRVPLGSVHGKRSAVALARAGVDIRLGTRVQSIESQPEGGYTVHADESVAADAVVVAVPPGEATEVMPAGAASSPRWSELGTSAIVDVHLVYDRRVTSWPLMAAVRSPVQWVFDRTGSSGVRAGQYLAVSISAADHLLGERPEILISRIDGELRRLLPAATDAHLIDSLVTKERQATFRAAPGTGRLRPGPRTGRPGLVVAGAWTDTGWPATMEGAVRSGRAAAGAGLADIRAGGNLTRTTQEVA